MLIHEFRVTMPLTAQEYWSAEVYFALKGLMQKTSTREKLQQIQDSGPYVGSGGGGAPRLGAGSPAGHCAKKIYRVENHLSPLDILISSVCDPGDLSPKEALESLEELWNASFLSKIEKTNPREWLKDAVVTAKTFCLEGDRGELDNVHELNGDQLGKRKVVRIDIANDPIPPEDYREDQDPTKFRSVKTGRGPLRGAGWTRSVEPVMTVYKLVVVEGKGDDDGVGGQLEDWVMESERKLVTKFHRRMFCSLDR